MVKKREKQCIFPNEYTYTEMLKQKYHKGDKVFVSGSGIKGVKRDTELVMLLGILIFVLVEAAGRKGILTIITVGINIMIFAVFFLKADNTSNVVAICNKIVILFAIVTLVGLNGVNKKTWAALLSTLCVLVLIMGMFDLVIRHVQELVTQRWNIWEALIIRRICSMRKYCYPDWVPLWIGAVAIAAALGKS